MQSVISREYPAITFILDARKIVDAPSIDPLFRLTHRYQHVVPQHWNCRENNSGIFLQPSDRGAWVYFNPSSEMVHLELLFNTCLML